MHELMKRHLIIAGMVVLIGLQAHAQQNMSISAGLGLPELVNAGIRYDLSPAKVGISIGTAFAGALALSGDAYYHFAGSSKLSKMPPWYLRANLTYWHFGKLLFVNLGEAMLLGFRVGRDMNLTEDLGISIDAGIIPLSFFAGRKIPFSFIPTTGVSVFYRLGK